MDINLKIENALKNKDIVNIMHSAGNTFRTQLDEDTLYSCKLCALWKALTHFKPEVGVKFTTYLHCTIVYECVKEVKQKKKHTQNRRIIHDNIASHNSADVLLIDLYDEAKTDSQKEMLTDKLNYISNRKIGEKYGVTRESIRKRYKKFTDSFREKFV
jgi:DNA-directed RNA polymerase specialized sigma subunit